ncbi:MAG: hypothetical protein LBN99_03645 [Oscillospiraceae bacterium]|jgi:hypothetical protein|nr:hypothetical protein [Oscillospiraceae bacterium]
MFGTNERFNLTRATYSRRGSHPIIFEDFNTPGLLRITSNRAGDPMAATDFLFDVNLTVDGAPVKYTYFADEGSLRLEADCDCAWAEIAITDRNHVRYRGENAGLQLVLRSATGGGARACRGIHAALDGSGWEGEFGKHGKLLVKAIAGAALATAVYDEEKGAFSCVKFDFLPDAETGEFEAVIHEFFGARPCFCDDYEPFDELVDNNKADYAAFAQKYADAAPGYEGIAKYAKWVIWSRRSATAGAIKEPMILFQNDWNAVAASWQQSYNAMPMLEDPKEAWRQICTLFAYQDERTGRLPGMLTYTGPNNAGMQPPFQGFALDFIIRTNGEAFLEQLTPSECERMYPKFAKWANFWTTYRSAGRGDDVTAILSPHESGWDDASVFKDGFPAIDPNTLAFLVLLFENVARLAEGCGKTAEAKEWNKRAEKLTQTLIKEHWDGEKFVTTVKGKAVDSKSLACYQPIILGKRLPQEIIDKVAEKLTEEGELLTEIGLASESMTSELATFGISFVCGRVVGPQNMILTVGLKSAGKDKEADLIARRFCDHVKREGVILGYAPYDYYPATGKKADQQIPPHPADGWPWSSWCANSFMTMATAIIAK